MIALINRTRILNNLTYRIWSDHETSGKIGRTIWMLKRRNPNEKNPMLTDFHVYFLDPERGFFTGTLMECKNAEDMIRGINQMVNHFMGENE